MSRVETRFGPAEATRLALAHLARLADVPPLPTQNADALAKTYADNGWRADWAALEALATVPRETDREAVAAVLRAIYVSIGVELWL
jgi:gamma-glutamyl:cysteine ligase YbdK (ATP-grasp superfamily)